MNPDKPKTQRNQILIGLSYLFSYIVFTFECLFLDFVYGVKLSTSLLVILS